MAKAKAKLVTPALSEKQGREWRIRRGAAVQGVLLAADAQTLPAAPGPAAAVRHDLRALRAGGACPDADDIFELLGWNRDRDLS